MYPMVAQDRARHRREPSTRQQIRAAIAVLIAIALIAGFGVFGGTLLGGPTTQARILTFVPGWIAGWAVYAIPAAGLFGLLQPSRSRIVRALAILLLIIGLPAALLMSKPRGMSSAEWQWLLGSDSFVTAAQATAHALLATLVLWAVALTFMLTTTRSFDELVARARRSVLWAAPLALSASLAAAHLA